MATRRDQLQSYQFLLQRVVSALVYRKTDPAQSPFRRAGGAVFAGIMLSVLALAITAVIGLFATGCGKTGDWREGGAIIREKETGTLYVIFPTGKEATGENDEQTLYEAANFASAALLVGTTDVYEIKAQSLRKNKKVSMGTTVGILGAPNSIPKPDAISGSPWTLCSMRGNGDDAKAKSKLYIGSMKASGPSLGKGHTLFVENDDATYLISAGRKHKIIDQEDAVIIDLLTVSDDDVKQVDQAFTNGIEEGEPITVPDFGKAGEESDIEGAPVGTVIEESGSGNTRYWVAMEDGIAEISHMQAQLISAKLGQGDKYSDAPLGGATRLDPLKIDGDGAPPERITRVAKPDGNTLCAAFSANGKAPKVMFDSELPKLNGVKTKQPKDKTAYADQIVVEPGTGALAQGSTKKNMGGVFLVTASGRLYGIDQGKPNPSAGGTAAPANAMTALGFDGEEKPLTVHMPAQVLKLIPQGPQLSPERAMDTVPGA